MTENTLHIAPAKAGSRPLKSNIFEYARMTNAQLAPLFPFGHPGAMVASAAAFRSDGLEPGSFHHSNTVEEVAIIFGSNIPNFRIGSIQVGALEHDVTGPPAEYPPAYVVFCIVQRQSETGVQNERIAFHCEKCHHLMHEHSFDSSKWEGDLPVLHTISGSEDAAVGFNQSDRICGKCNHVNEEFPAWRWGWGEYVRRTAICRDAKKAFIEAAAGK